MHHPMQSYDSASYLSPTSVSASTSPVYVPTTRPSFSAINTGYGSPNVPAVQSVVGAGAATSAWTQQDHLTSPGYSVQASPSPPSARPPQPSLLDIASPGQASSQYGRSPYSTAAYMSAGSADLSAAWGGYTAPHHGLGGFAAAAAAVSQQGFHPGYGK